MSADRSDHEHAGTLPAGSLFDAVVGQPRAVAALRAAARRPVHAYLLHGPPGSGTRLAARAFAAALLCPSGGCGACATCRRALAGHHPDLVEVARTGASVDVETARRVVAQAQRRPREGTRQVLVVADVHLAAPAVPALLKTVEEPPPGTIFVLVADDLPDSLTTLASRCVPVPFDPVPEEAVARWLEDAGTDPATAAAVARRAGGNLDRARLLATDAGFAARQERWRTVRSRLDGTGAGAVRVADELLATVDESIEPLRRQHEEELRAAAERAELAGVRSVPGRRELEERHRREERRWRTDELRAGLAVLAGGERDRLAGPDPRAAAAALDRIAAASAALVRNPNEGLLLEALLAALSDLDA